MGGGCGKCAPPGGGTSGGTEGSDLFAAAHSVDNVQRGGEQPRRGRPQGVAGRPREIFGKTGRALEADVMVVSHGAKTMADDARMRKAEAQQHEFEAKG